MNGQSQGVRKRNSQDFPAAGLRWNVKLAKGQNALRAVSVGKEALSDELSFEYQTEKWGKEHAFKVTSTPREDGTVEIEAQLMPMASDALIPGFLCISILPVTGN